MLSSLSDNGIVRTLDQTVYLVRVKGRVVFCLDRYARPKTLAIDPTEYRFKTALVKRDYEEMLQIIKNSSLVGQSIIAYLQKKGYPEIALQFVQDPLTRFELAIECGNLDVALEMAKELDRSQLWTKLSSEALVHGNHQVAEIAYQKTRSFDKLSFLYLSTGDKEKLTRMARIARNRNDCISQYQNSIYLGDVADQVRVLREIEQYPLAYMTAKTHGLTELCEEILEASGLTEDQVMIPAMHKAPRLARPVVATYQRNWPARPSADNVFEKVLSGAGQDADIGLSKAMTGLKVEASQDADGTQTNGHAVDDEDDADGWGVIDDVHVPEEEAVPDVSSTGHDSGLSEAEMWSRNSPIAADHVAGGSFDTAMQLLNRQLGAVNFEPLKPRFMEIYSASRTQLPAFPGLPPLTNYVRRNIEETDPKKGRPIIPRDLDHLASQELEQGFTALRKNELSNARQILKNILHALMVNAVVRQNQVTEVREL